VNDKRQPPAAPAAPGKVPTGLVSVDDAIDDVARQALEAARRREEAEKLRRENPPAGAPRPKDPP
jgi:hypothetical protein